MRGVLATGTLLVGTFSVVAAGCVIFTGTSEGYTTAEAGAALGQGCSGPSDCQGQKCCYDPEGGIAPPTCATTCASPADQVCTQASDCGDGGICFSQSCVVDAGPITVTVPVKTCGAVPICSQ